MFKLLSDYNYLRLQAGLLVAHFADAAMQIALMAWISSIFQIAGKEIAMAFFLYLLPEFILSPFLGIIADKFNRKNIMVISNLYRFCIISLIIYIINNIEFLHLQPNELLIIVYILAFILGSGYALLYSAKMSVFANVLPQNQLKTANTLSSGLINFVNIFGVAVSGIILLKVGLNKLILTVAVFYFLAALFFSMTKIRFPQKGLPDYNVSQNIKKAAKYIINHKAVAFLIFISFCASLTLGIFINELNILTIDYYKLGVTGVTAFRTMHGVGILLGMILMIALSKIKNIKLLLMFSFLLMGTVTYTANECTTLSKAWFWLISFGIANVVSFIIVDTYTQKLTPDRLRGKVFGLQLTINTLAYLLGAFTVSKSTMEPLLMYQCLGFFTLVVAVCCAIRAKYNIKNLK